MATNRNQAISEMMKQKREQLDGVPGGDLTRRLLNKLGRPFGVNPFPRTFSNPLVEEGQSRQQVFERIFATNFWGSTERYSGLGSEKAFTQKYCRHLQRFIVSREITSLFDAPCGDLNWMHEVIAATHIRYIGGDIARSVVETARNRYPAFELRVFDICKDSFPLVDVWHCRDCLFHLPFSDIRQALANFVSSEIPYALLTTHKGRLHYNLDVTRGGFRYLDLERAPINLRPAVAYLRDYTLGVDFPRYVGLWPREEVARALVGWR
jgi:hypothetical protein